MKLEEAQALAPLLVAAEKLHEVEGRLRRASRGELLLANVGASQ